MGGAAQREEFEKWLDERPRWLQTAASRVIAEHKKPTPTEISALADLCITEASGTQNTMFERVPTGAFGAATAGQITKLLKIENVQGVNAIKAGARLDLGQSNLVIVYGMNGAGKSGYSRLLKNICGTRSKQDIHPDVFSTTTPAISAEITASINGKNQTFGWTAAGGPIGYLRNVQVFDSHTANSYVHTKNEASYEPRRMRFLSTLIEIVDQVAAELGRRKSAMPSALPTIPQDYFGTAAQIFIKGLKSNLSQGVIDAACRWTANDDAQRLAIETSLKQTDILARLKELAATKSRLNLVKQGIANLKEGLSDAKASEIILAQANVIASRRAAAEDAAKVFANSALDGVGQDSWKLMWEQARAYSEALAYPEKKFPVVDKNAKCVLCHHPLDDNAKGRLANFERFVKGGLEAAARGAESALSKLLEKLPKLPEKERWDVDVEFLKLNPAVGKALFNTLASRLKGIKDGVAMGDLPVAAWEPIEAAIIALEAINAKEEAALTELQKDGKRQELEKQLKELKARSWLFEQKSAIETEIARLKRLAAIEAAERLAKTNALSQKKNDLARDELANGYRDRFFAELEALGGKRIPVAPVAIPERKGKVSFQLSLNGTKLNVPTPEVLSEGENRIVALSAFIADMLGSAHLAPFVFDDPISSLDQEFEERVVDRLVALSKTRQVIVFTHRLSLMALLEEAVKKVNQFAVAHGGAIDEPVIISLRRFGNVVGITEDVIARNMKPNSGFNVLNMQSIPRIKKYLEGNQIPEYEYAIKAACSDFRILIERCIEQTLLCDVVGRFRRAVNSQKIRLLPKMKPDDCAFLDDLMTRYSRYEHSQSLELSGELPKLEELIQDITNAQAWQQEYEKRIVA